MQVGAFARWACGRGCGIADQLFKIVAARTAFVFKNRHDLTASGRRRNQYKIELARRQCRVKYCVRSASRIRRIAWRMLQHRPNILMPAIAESRACPAQRKSGDICSNSRAGRELGKFRFVNPLHFFPGHSRVVGKRI